MFEKLTGQIRITNSKYQTQVPKFVSYKHYKMESINVKAHDAAFNWWKEK